MALAGQALSDPSGSAPLADAALWVQHLLLGTTATFVAILTIAAIGFLALSGRIELRRGATTIIGCFILIGAPGIAAAFVHMFNDGDQSAVVAGSPPPPVAALRRPPPPPPSAYDPYAGASVERR